MVLNTSSPTTVRWLEEFEKYVFDIVKSIKFRNGSDNFQNKLRSDTLSKSQATCLFLQARLARYRKCIRKIMNNLLKAVLQGLIKKRRQN